MDETSTLQGYAIFLGQGQLLKKIFLQHFTFVYAFSENVHLMLGGS